MNRRNLFFFFFMILICSSQAEIIEVSGDQSGVWENENTYQVVEHIYVYSGNTLVIEPGTTVEFMGDFIMTIYGILLAEGTITDSILFTSGQPHPGYYDWDYIKFLGWHPSPSRMAFCIIEHAHYGVRYYDNSNPLIQDCTLRHNSICMRVYYSAPQIERCQFSDTSIGIDISGFSIQFMIKDNLFDGCSYGINCQNGLCIIENNQFRNCETSGVSILTDYVEVTDNIFYNCGAGIFSNSGSLIKRNIISDCDTGIQLESSDLNELDIIKNTFYNCGQGIVDLDWDIESPITIASNIFQDVSTIFDISDSFYFSINHNLFWEYDTLATDISYADLGILSNTNINGDPCDIYYNLVSDPLCLDPDNQDFHLLENSPAINAGLDLPEYSDPDGTISDIGARYFPLGPELPVASFQADQLFGDAPLLVNFINNSTGEIDTYFWDFGDGNTSQEEAPSHIYDANGSYSVSLTLSGAGVTDSMLREDYIEVAEQMEVSGIQSGIWNSIYTYRIMGDVQINSGDTLWIESGTQLKFMGYYTITIEGTLLAIGTESDSIRFTSGSPFPAINDWQTISFSGGNSSGSIIDHAVIEYGCFGITVTDSEPTISNSRIGKLSIGIDCHNSSALITGNLFTNNLTRAIRIYDGNDTISNNVFTKNGTAIRTDDAYALITENFFMEDNQRSIVVYDTPVEISYNVFTDYNDGIRCLGSDSQIHHNIFNNGLECAINIKNYSNAVIYNNTFCNGYTGMSFDDEVEAPQILNNLFYNNNQAIESEVCLENLEYNLFYSNTLDYAGSMPLWFGTINSYNYNEDPCDMNFNLFMSPEFVNAPQMDFHLLENSPCIDAGNPDPAYNDPDCTISDIGALYYQLIIDNDIDDIPQSGITLTNYPNPFNPSTTIAFELSQPGNCILKIYNLKGELVKTLLSENLPAGKHTVTWNGRDKKNNITASGIYFCRLKTGDNERTRRILQIK